MLTFKVAQAAYCICAYKEIIQIGDDWYTSEKMGQRWQYTAETIQDQIIIQNCM